LDEKQRFSLKINFEHDDANNDCGRNLWLISKISPSPKIKFIKAGDIAGGDRFCLTGSLRQALICHCRDCFQIAGLSWGSTSVPDASFELTAQQTLGWYDSSAWAKRGFCRNCGASLFYRLNGIARTSVAIGMLDDANDMVISGQIFANSHPHWDRLRPYDLPHLDDQFWGKKS
jgi:hypothetical protein